MTTAYMSPAARDSISEHSLYKSCKLWGQASEVHSSVAPRTSLVIFLKLLEPQFPHLEIGNKMESAGGVAQVENEVFVEI